MGLICCAHVITVKCAVLQTIDENPDEKVDEDGVQEDAQPTKRILLQHTDH